MRIRAMWCGVALLLAAVSGCGSTIAGTPVAAGFAQGGGGGSTGGPPASGSLTEALLTDADFPSGGAVQRMTSFPGNTTMNGSTSTPPECAAKVSASQLTGTDNEIAVAVHTGSDGTILMEALQRPASNLVAVFQDILNTCGSFQLTTAQGLSFTSTFQTLPVQVFDSQPTIAVRQEISGEGQSIDTYAAIEESQGVTLYVAAVRPSAGVDESQLLQLARTALARKRSILH